MESTPHQQVTSRRFFDSDKHEHSEVRSTPKPFEKREPLAIRPRPKMKKLSGMIAIVLVFVAAIGGTYVFRGDVVKQLFNRDTSLIPATSTPPPDRVRPTSLPAATPTPTPTPLSTPTILPVAELLTRARVYLEASQFTTPPEKNALEIYQQVLAIDPANAEARQGLLYMLDTYADWVDGNCLKARGYYPYFRQIAQYVHSTLRDDAVKKDALKAEQAFQGCDL